MALVDAALAPTVAGDAMAPQESSQGAMRFEHVFCPRCAADDSRLVLKLAIAEMVTCQRCGMSYVCPRAANEVLQQKLQSWAEQDVVDEERLRNAFEPGTQLYYSRFLDCLGRNVRSSGRRLLDLGCSTGAFLSVARDAGWAVSGIEIGAASAGYAREVLGLDVQRGSMFDLDSPSASWDAIALIEVIEHLEHPRRALDRALSLLKPGGALLVTTPNFDSLYRRLFGNRWWVVNCEDEHIVLFNLESLAGMLEDAGFEVVFRHIQGIDTLGLMREMRQSLGLRSKFKTATNDAAGGYYESRSAKGRIKALLSRMGALSLARSISRGLDRTYGWRWSPTYAWGEQLVVVARPRQSKANAGKPAVV